jgi:raffinose/stachyose/melibiose transport system permease protein
VGLNNYVRAFTDDRSFINTAIFTIKFALVSVALINITAFSLALLLARKIKGTNTFRTVFFMPNLIGGIVLSYIWQLIINGCSTALAWISPTMPATGFGDWSC